jgi:hypothetical protein
MVTRTLCAALLALLLLGGAAPSQDYRFEVPEFLCNVSVEKDRSLVIYYKITFRCAPGAHPVDIVDIGFPSKDFQLDTVRAQLDGQPLGGIKISTYVTNGVEIPLGNKAIAPGATGTLEVSGTNLYMVFQDSDVPADGSVEFSPTWFDGSLLEGVSNFTLQLQLPEDAEPDKVRHHERAFTEAFVTDAGRVVYKWVEQRRVDGQYMVGASFPGTLVEGPLTPPEAPAAASSGSGDDFFESGCFVALVFLIPILPAAISIVRGIYRRRKYLPPKIGVEGVGIKRGLTAPMAALLNEEKLDKVTVLILYGLLRKGAVKLKSGPAGKIVIEKTDADQGKMWEYEIAFLDALKADGSLGDKELKSMFVQMIKDLNSRMKGFSLKETREYYRSIMRQAWEMVRTAGPDAAGLQTVEEQLQWMMMDHDFDDKVRKLPPIVLTTPHWFPAGGWLIDEPAAGGGPSPVAPAGGVPAAPVGGMPVPAAGGFSLTDLCHQTASAIENFSHRAVGSFGSLVSDVTGVTNPIPVSSSSGRSSGGRSCACACACAGCACACAGGGR